MGEISETLKLLEELCLTAAPSGMEDKIRKVIKEKLKGYVDKIEVSPLGDIIAFKKGTGAKSHKILIDAHVDEIGCLVRFIDDKGFIRLQPTGYFDTKATIGQAMTVFTRKGEVEGVVGAKYPILETGTGGAEKIPPFSELFLDIGAESREEVLSWGVQLGDQVAFSRRFIIIGKGTKCMGTALDNRAGVYTLIEVMKSLSESPVEADVYVSFNAQEEATIGRHAALCTRIVNPHVVIELCPSLAADIPGVREDMAITKQGNGVSITLHETSATEEPFSGYIAHPKLLELFTRVAKENNIKYQLQVSTVYVLTGAPFMRLTNGGIPAIALNIPLRNGHTPYETMSISDVINCKKLVQAALPYIDSAFIENTLPLE
jgi:endoglucanase